MHDNEEHIQSKPKHDRLRDASNKMWKGHEKQVLNGIKNGHFRQNREKPKNFEEKPNHNNAQNHIPTGWICGSKGHKAFTCPQKASGNNQNKQHGHNVVACHTMNSESCECRVVNVPGVGKIPKIAAMSNSAIREREILDTSRSPVSRGEANGVEVECLRDTGSSVSIVRSSLVKPDQYTGKEVACILVDQCLQKCLQAEIIVKTELYDGKLPLVCMDRCIYDLIVGNDVHNVTQKEMTVKIDDVFTARLSYASVVLGVVILSVCPSHACFVTNPKNLPAIFFIPHERAILLVFCHPTVVGGRRPFAPKMGD